MKTQNIVSTTLGRGLFKKGACYMKSIAAILMVILLPGCFGCNPIDCPVDRSPILQLEEITDGLTRRAAAGLPPASSIEEALGIELPFELEKGGVLFRSTIDRFVEPRSVNYVLHLSGKEVNITYRLNPIIARRTRSRVHFWYRNSWGSYECSWWNAGSEWFCMHAR